MKVKKDLSNYKSLGEVYQQLEVNQEFKSFNALCDFLSQPRPTGGRNKQLAIDRFSYYFDFERIPNSNKLIINHVYDIPLTQYSRGYISSMIQKIILDYLVKELKKGEHEVILSKNSIYNELSLVNYNYSVHGNDYNDKIKRTELNPILESKLGVNKFDVDYFYKSTSTKFKQYIKTALVGLEKKFLIKYNTPIVVCVGRDDETSEIRLADSDENILLIKIQNDICTELKCKNDSDIFMRGLTFVFRAMVIDRFNDYIKDNQEKFNYINLEYYYKGYHIMFIDKVIEEQDKLNEYILDNLSDVQQALNNHIIDKYKESYVNIYNKSIDKLNEKYSGSFDDFVSDENTSPNSVRRLENKARGEFVENGHKLIDYTIKR